MSRRGENPNSLRNLEGHKWKPGQSGNPKGRPRKQLTITHLTRDQLGERCPDDPKGGTWAQYIAERWLILALTNPSYFLELMARIEGKTTQPVSGEETHVILVIDNALTETSFKA